MLDQETLPLLQEALAHLEMGFADLPPIQTDTNTQNEQQAMREILLRVAEKMRDNFPYPHPLYAGQMLTPPHPMARLAYMLALWINPNNHALDGGRASSALEKEAVANIATMLGWKQHLGHLTSGGTIANLEALWIAGLLAPHKKIVASKQAHYTHERVCAVLKIPYQSIPTDSCGRMDIQALEDVLKTGEVGTVVVTLGTTALGAVDPLPAILALREKYSFRIHVDSAYGGYFTLSSNLSSSSRAAYDALEHVDSFVVDPHKLGLQPYGCGCILLKDPTVGRFYKHDSPYTYFSSEEMHLGEITLECSRAGAAAVALWATQQLFPLVKGGAFAKQLDDRREAALDFQKKLQASRRWFAPIVPETNIVVWMHVDKPTENTNIQKTYKASEISASSRRIFTQAAQHHLHLACATLPKAFFAEAAQQAGIHIEWDTDDVVCLRSCLMKPEQRDWIDHIMLLLDKTLLS